jgi:hypothetical protein
MFYKKEHVNEAITCGICAQIYIDPRILPCGDSACNECIQSASNSENEFDCNFCNEKHTLASESGFPVNKQLLKLLQAPAEAVSRNNRVEELKRKLDEVKTKCDSFKFGLDNGVDQINEHYTQMRNQVDLQTELVIQQAHELNESMRDEIDKYEKEAIEDFKRTKLESNQDIEKLISEVQTFHLNTSKHLNEFKIDEQIVEDALISAAKIIQDFDNKSVWPMVETKMKFIKNESKLDKTIIGCFANEKAGFGQLKFCELDLSIICDYKSHINLIALDDNDFLVFYINKDSRLSCIAFNKSNVKSPSNIVCNAKIDKLNVARMDDGLTVAFNLMQKDQSVSFINAEFQFSVKDKRQCVFMVPKVDINFSSAPLVHSKHAIATRISITFIAASKSYLLIINSVEASACIILNSMLEMLNNLPLKDILEGDETIADVKINETNIFFLCSTNKLKIVDLRTLATVKVIEVKANQIELLPSATNPIIVLFDSTNAEISHYDQCGDFKRVGGCRVPLKNYRDATSGLKILCNGPKLYTLYNSTLIN